MARASGTPSRWGSGCATTPRRATRSPSRRAFDPEIYITARRRYGCRFFWTLFLTWPTRAYRRQDFLAEDRACFEAHRPKYVVAVTGEREGPDSPAWFEALGYVRLRSQAEFTVMERR